MQIDRKKEQSAASFLLLLVSFPSLIFRSTEWHMRLRPARPNLLIITATRLGDQRSDLRPPVDSATDRQGLPNLVLILALQIPKVPGLASDFTVACAFYGSNQE